MKKSNDTPKRPDPKGPSSPGNDCNVKYGGNKPNGEKNSSDGKGSYTGH